MKFLEVEHKFIVSQDFPLDEFKTACRRLRPVREKTVVVQDSYYLPEWSKDFILRHRQDAELHQLTVKTRNADPQVRTEVNLELAAAAEAAQMVTKFMQTIGTSAPLGIEKTLLVFDFADCEVVHYAASHAGRCIYCVEFEARQQKDLQSAYDVLQRYEKALGFNAQDRCSVNLFDLLIPAQFRNEL